MNSLTKYKKLIDCINEFKKNPDNSNINEISSLLDNIMKEVSTYNDDFKEIHVKLKKSNTECEPHKNSLDSTYKNFTKQLSNYQNV